MGSILDWFLWRYWKANKPFLAAFGETLIGDSDGPLRPDGKEIVEGAEKFLREVPRPVFRQAMLAIRLLPMSYPVRLSPSPIKRTWAKVVAALVNNPARLAFVAASKEKRVEKVKQMMERLRDQAPEAEDDPVKNIALLSAVRGLLQSAYLELPSTWQGLGYDPFPSREWNPPSGQNIRNPPQTRNSAYLVEGARRLRDATKRPTYCVIGSGAGGATAAYTIQQRDPQARIVLLESGPLFPNNELPIHVMESLAKLYMNAGTTLSRNQKFTFRQGHCVGGSTLLNNAVALKPQGFWWDTNIVQRWSDMGVDLRWPDLNAAYDDMSALLNVHELDPRVITRQARTLRAGFEALGNYTIHTVAANLRDCIGCGRCNVGCPYDAKQSMAHTTIPRFLEAGGELVPDAHVHELRFGGPPGARRVRSVCVKTDGYKTEIEADKVVLAAGAYASSKLLWRSGFGGAEPGITTVGTQFSGNFGAGVFGRFPERQNGFDGQQIGYVIEVPQERMVIETAFAPPPALGWMAPQWGERFMDMVKSCDHIAAAVPVFGSSAYGTMNSGAVPRQFRSGFAIDFDLEDDDYRRLAVGMEATARAMFAAGAEQVFSTRFDAKALDRGGNVDEYFGNLRQLPFQYLKIETSHLQGGNPTHPDPSLGVVNGNLKVHGLDNLWITDASVIPAPITLNIQLTVMALAAYAAPGIAAA